MICANGEGVEEAKVLAQGWPSLHAARVPKAIRRVLVYFSVEKVCYAFCTDQHP